MMEKLYVIELKRENLFKQKAKAEINGPAGTPAPTCIIEHFYSIDKKRGNFL